MVENYARWIVNNRWLAIVISLVVILGLASGGRFLAFTNDYRVFFSDDNPQLLAFEELQATYTKSDNIMIMLEPTSEDVFTSEVLTAVVDLTERAWQVPYSVRVDSLSNYQYMTADGDDLLVADLVEDSTDLSAEALADIRQAALAQPTLVNKLLSPRADVTGVNITVEMPEKRVVAEDGTVVADPALALQEAVVYARSMIDEIKSAYPDIKFSTTGVVMMNQAFPDASLKDMSTIIPLAFGVIIVGILVLIASPVAMVATVIVVLLSILGAMGTAGWLGIKLTPPSASAPTLILTLAVADCIHFLVTLYQRLRLGDERADAIVESLRINFMPIFLTSITTAIGFMSMNFSDAPPFRDLGNITAIGVMLAFFLAVFFLPALTALLPVRAKTRDSNQSTIMDHVSNVVIRFQKPLLAAGAITIVGLAAFAPTNQLNDVFTEYFDETVPFRVETDRVNDKLSGMYLVDYSVDTKEEGGISNPEFLQQLERFERYLEEQPEVQHVNAFTETMRRLNRSMNGDDDAYYRLPESRELAAQYELLYQMSLPYGLDLNNQINFDKSKTRVTATIETLSTQQMLAFEQRVADWMTTNVPDIATLGSGPTLMFSHISLRNIVSMLTGTGIALVLISAILIVALRSFKFGMISLIPNIMPALMAFGVWGLMVGEVGLAVSVVVAMTLGIVVDDTIHFLSKYLRARRERGMDAEAAVRYAFNTVGVALTVTTIVLVAGFLVISQSNFLVNSQMGLLTAITITIALIVDFLFLPPLLIALDRGQGKTSPSPEISGPTTYR